MTGNDEEARPRSLSAEANSEFSRISGRREAGNDVRSRRVGDVTAPNDRVNERGVPYAALAAVAAVATALLTTGADAVLTAAAGVDLTALVRGDPWLIADLDAALGRASVIASRAAFLTRVAAATLLAWVGVRAAVRYRA
ncbi:hypothetical protein [Haloparvum sedimenti]|uniref:hypothetical protein n=1 Tax=Haloparvum sedimenti TaxID=1678448 RepID=UPI00071E7FA2|nr:hypothetical protein [Haloparvum sedimenti]